MLNQLAQIIIILSAIFFLFLGVIALFKPTLAAGFLLRFATSAKLHYIELSVRIALGLAFVFGAEQTAFPQIIRLFGQLLIGTSLVLALLPWRWHQKFAKTFVLPAMKFLPLIGISSLGMGGAVLYALFVAS